MKIKNRHKKTHLGNLGPGAAGVAHLLETMLFRWRPRCVRATLLGRWRRHATRLSGRRKLNGRSASCRRGRSRRLCQGRACRDGRGWHCRDCAGSGSRRCGNGRRDDGRGRGRRSCAGQRLLGCCRVRPLARALGHGRRCCRGRGRSGGLLL